MMYYKIKKKGQTQKEPKMARKVMFRTWEEITYSNGTKKWHTVGYARRPHSLPTKETKASWFFEMPNGQRVKVSKTDRALFDDDGFIKDL